MIIIYQTNMNNKIYDVIFEMIFSRGVIFILFFFRLIRILNMQTRRKIKIGSYVDDIEDFNIQFNTSNIPHTSHQRIDSSKEQSDKTIKNQLNQYSLNNSEGSSTNSVMPSLVLRMQKSEKMIKNLKGKEQIVGHGLDINEDNLDNQNVSTIAKKPLENSQMITQHKKKTHDLSLKDIIKEERVKNICRKFIDKLQINNTSSEPAQYKNFSNQKSNSIWSWEGFQSPHSLFNLVCFLNIIMVIALTVQYSLEIVFEDIRNSQQGNILSKICLIYFVFELAYNCTTVKSYSGRKLIILGDIINYYFEQAMVIDLVNIIILAVSLYQNWSAFLFIRLFIITKLPQCLDRLDKLEVSFIKNYYNEQYWSLVKVVLFNFCFAHILAIFLSAMADLNPVDNWQKIKGLAGEGWFPKYVWAYYWGVNIMLTVGFGDLSATNHREALCLIFIEIFSVMCLAYNINWIGTLISNIRAQDLEKGKNYKTFKQLSDKYGLPNELQWRISNYIEESVNIRKKFNIEEENAFVKSLPTSMKKQYLKETNKSIFQQIPFFSGLVNRTLYQLAQKIQMNISHPEQLLKKIEDDFNLLILREGSVGFTAKRRNCGFNDCVIDSVKVKNNDKPFVLGLEFLTRFRPIYETKSLEYSVVYSLNYDELIGILRDSHMDYLHFCVMRDKNRSIPDEFQVLECNNCKKGKKHTKFTCPKLHFVPLNQMVIYKYIHKEKIFKNERYIAFQRTNTDKLNALKYKNMMKYLLDESPYKKENQNKDQMDIKFNIIKKLVQLKKKFGTQSQATDIMEVDDWLIKNTSEIIKLEFQKLKKVESFEDEVWTIQCDKIKNYKQYFPEGNASNLQYAFDLNERIMVIQEKRKMKMESLEFQKTIKQLNEHSRKNTVISSRHCSVTQKYFNS